MRFITTAAVVAVCTALLHTVNAQTGLGTYELYEPNDLVERYKSEPDEFSYGAMQNSSNPDEYLVTHVATQFAVFAVLAFCCVCALCCYNCMTCAEFDKQRVCCWGKLGPVSEGCNNIIPPPIKKRPNERHYREHIAIKACIVALIIAVFAVYIYSEATNVEQGEAITSIPNVIGSIAAYINVTVRDEFHAISLEAGYVGLNITALARASDNEFSPSPINLTQDFANASAATLEIIRSIEGEHNTAVNAFNANSPITGFVDDSNELFNMSLPAATTDILGVLSDISQAFYTGQDDAKRELETFDSQTRKALLSLGLLVALVTMCIMSCAAYANLTYKQASIGDCVTCKPAILPEGTTGLITCGRNQYRKNCGLSAIALTLTCICCGLVAAAFAVTVATADLCSNPIQFLSELIDDNHASYYIECHKYTTTQLRDEFPWAAEVSEVQGAWNTLNAVTKDIHTTLDDLGASSTLLSASQALNITVTRLGDRLLMDNGTIGFNGIGRCAHINPFVHELLIDICTDFYSTLAVAFELCCVLGCCCIIFEVCLKCSRRELDEFHRGSVGTTEMEQLGTSREGGGGDSGTPSDSIFPELHVI